MDRMTTQRVLKIDGTPSVIPVVSAGNAYSHSVEIKEATAFAVSMKMTGTGPDVDVYVEQTHIKPVTEGEAISAANGWAQPVGAVKVADLLASGVWYHFTVSPLALPYLRFLLDGQGANPADSTVEIHITKLVNFN